MSKNLSAVAVTEFDSMVKHAYQGMGLLKGGVTVRNNVVGDTYKFRRMGKGLANQKSTSDLVTPMDVSHEFKTATLANWNAPEYPTYLMPLKLTSMRSKNLQTRLQVLWAVVVTS